MESQSIAVDFKKPLDLKTVASKVSSLQFVDGANVLAAEIGSLRVILFPNGIARITRPGSVYSDLGIELSKAAFQVGKLFEEVNNAAGLGVDVGIVMSKLVQEEVQFDYLQSIPFDSIRQGLGDKVDLRVMLAYLMGAEQVTGEFQLSRMNSQAGELIGRGTVKTAKPRNEAELVQLASKTIQELGLGTVAYKKQALEKSGGDAHLFTVNQCYCIGSPVAGKPSCNIIRGLLRGAVAQFLRQENVLAEEVECWQNGDTSCVFHVKIGTV